jgi:hypothetical protein
MDITELGTGHSHQPLVKIGAGACGTVLAEKLHVSALLDDTSEPLALKRADAKSNRDLAHESAMHQEVLAKFTRNKSVSQRWNF